MIESIKTLFAFFRMLAEARIGRVEKPFEQIVRPIHQDFTKIHSRYQEIFSEARLTCREIAADWNTSDPEKLQRFNDCKEKFSKAREEREDLRWKLREEAAAVIKLSDHEETRRYLASVIHYFLEYRSPEITDETLDDVIENVIEKGGETYYATPSASLELKLNESDSPGEAAELIEDKIEDLNRRYVAIAARFTSLTFSVIADNPFGGPPAHP